MARKQSTGDKSRLAVRYLDNEIVLSEKQAWTYMRIPLLSYEFQSYEAREAFCEQITLALSTLITNNEESVEAHLRIVHRPLDVGDWRAQLRSKVNPQNPTSGWNDYLNKMAYYVDDRVFDQKEVYLGVMLGIRGAGAGVSELLTPVKFFNSLVETAVGIDEQVISDTELAMWKKKARDVHRAVESSYLHGVPATSEEIAWVISRSLWPDMLEPKSTYSNAVVWGPGETRQLATGVVTHHRRYVEVEQINEFGESITGYQATLAVSRFPDVLNFPEQEPWIHFAAAQKFPVDFSTRLSIVPSSKVQKDIGKRLADAKDQAQHIAQSGTSVPLAVRANLEIATSLEYTIDKERIPWAYARHRIIVTGATPEILTANIKTLKESYRELRIDVEWPSGDQFELMCESMPGDTVRTTSYFQRQELSLIAGGMPTASSEVGDQIVDGRGWMGPYLGYTTSRMIKPVFFSPHVAMTRNYPPGVAITGAPGGGKSFLAFTLAHQMALQGVWTIYIDPKADAKPMGSLPGLGKPRVFDLREGNDGMLDPFSLGTTSGESALLALETLRLLLGGGSVSEDREEALLNAIQKVSEEANPSLNKVVDTLLESEFPAGRNLGSVLRTMRGLPFARLCFSQNGGDALRPEDGLTVVTLLGLDLPAAGTDSEDYSYENRLAVSVMYLLTRYARQLMLNMDKGHPKAICIDEAWAITSTPQGAKLIPEIARMGRSHNTALVLVSQNAGDLMNESVTNSLSTKFAFRSSIPQELNNVMDLMGLSKDQGYQSTVRDLRNGECLMQDVDGRVSRVKIEQWNQETFNAFNTNPETRGKAAEER